MDYEASWKHMRLTQPGVSSVKLEILYFTDGGSSYIKLPVDDEDGFGVKMWEVACAVHGVAEEGPGIPVERVGFVIEGAEAWEPTDSETDSARTYSAIDERWRDDEIRREREVNDRRRGESVSGTWFEPTQKYGLW